MMENVEMMINLSERALKTLNAWLIARSANVLSGVSTRTRINFKFKITKYNPKANENLRIDYGDISGP